MSESTPPPAPANPYLPPQTVLTTESGPPVNAKYDGIGRVGFLISYLAIFGLMIILGAGNVGPIALIALLLLMLPASSRLKNIGRNPAWCLLLLVPFLNLFVFVPCLVLPPGHQHHRKLDTPAKIIAALLVLGLIGLAATMFVTLSRA